ncbi:hypothetical protein [Pseudonocardia sp. TRM90224]|uniref:hypothetical protein n=1 Tax=Pseudonocardia sp. TRM90224 TaxID=2812678 RepID=UPI001E2AA32C|nr:hypothetical protein [Pseudonocardia sp. TRM90224]
MATNTRPRPTPQPMPPELPATEPQPAAPDLTVNKVLAGAGAAATSAILGSYFGVAGTVTGAAIGSVASTIATSLYQRSLDRTHAAVAARVRLAQRVGGRVAPGEVTVPIPRLPADAETVQLRAEPDVPRRRSRGRLAAIAGVTALVFLLGMLTVTGIEWIKGSPLNADQPGTSVGRVIHSGQPATNVPDVTSDDPDGSDERSADPTETGSPTTAPTTVPPTSENPAPTTITPPSSEEPDRGGLLPTFPRPTQDAPSPN